MQIETPFNEAILKKYPEQVAIILAKGHSGKINPVTIGWLMLTSHEPPMMAFSVGVTRFSLTVIREAGECVIAFPSEHQDREVLLFGTRSGRDVDKLALSGIATVPAKKVDCVLIDEAVANFECVIRSEYPTGDHVIFVAEVIASHIQPSAPGRLYTVAKGYKMAGVRIKQEKR